MSMSNNTARNMRNGQITVSDGSGTPKTATIALDEGNLQWTENKELVTIRNRGQIVHYIEGDEQECELTFTIKWSQLLGFTEASGDSNVLYEMVNNISSTYTSTFSSCSGVFCLKYEFTCTDPCGVASEKVTFPQTFKVSLQCGEGQEYNTIAFTGRDTNPEPTVARVA